MADLLPPHRRYVLPHYGLCAMSGCERRARGVVVVTVGGAPRQVPACAQHARTLTPPPPSPAGV